MCAPARRLRGDAMSHEGMRPLLGPDAPLRRTMTRRCVQCGYTREPQPIIEGTWDPIRKTKAKYED